IWSKYDTVGIKLILDSLGDFFAGGINNMEQLTVGKYDINGDRIWKKKYSFAGSAGTDIFGGFARDGFGNLIITGQSKSTTTFYDFATIKYSNNGVLLWSRRYNGPSTYSFDAAYGVTTDIYGNVYVTGTSMDSTNAYDFTTIKYDRDGNVIWIKRIPASQLIATTGYNLITDSSQNVFIAGRLGGRTSIVKMDINGNVLWYRVYPEGSAITSNYPVILHDSIYNIYTTAISTATGAADYAAIKYDSSGNQIYAVTYNNSSGGFEYVRDLAVDKQGSIYLTGEFSANGRSYGTVKFSPLPTGISPNNNLPGKYSLGQNYPNPFNPSTVINFSLPKSSFVSLKIYDGLGREVSTLVNEKKSAGNYQYVFDANNFSTGVYFYTLQADDFGETKRMILIK
ncbi:MAG: T9SS type A sorting domain-containing protein, partial [Ignavibacteria bacterium]